MIVPIPIATLALLASGLTPPTPTDSFEAHLERAQAAFQEEQYEAAAEELEAAYALSPDDDVLFNWANAERLAGDCEHAVQLYDRYLGAVADDVVEGDDVSARYSKVAEQRRRECAETVASQPEPQPDTADERPEVPPPVLVPDPATRPPPTPDRPEPVPGRGWRDPLGWSLTGVGVAALGTGAGLLGAGLAREPNAADESSHESYLDHLRTATRLEAAGWSLLGVGSALVVAGIVRLAVVSRRGTGSDRRRRASVSPALIVRF